MTLLKQIAVTMAQLNHSCGPISGWRPPSVIVCMHTTQSCTWRQRPCRPGSNAQPLTGMHGVAPPLGWKDSHAVHCNAPRLHRLYCTSRTQQSSQAGAAEDPIIMTIGWLGARQRPFEKYDDLWRETGYQRRLSVRPHLSSLVAPPLGDLVARKAVQRLVQASAQHSAAPVFLHLFSGGGYIFAAWMFQQLAHLQQTKEVQALPSRLAGIILDSSPAPVTADVSSRAIVAALLGQPVAGVELRYPWLVQPTSATIKAYLGLPLLIQRLKEVNDTWQSSVPACPQLYLYSDADALVDASIVEAAMSQQAARGAPVTGYKWADSGHVEHYKQHPQQYREQLERFVDSSVDWHRQQHANGASRLQQPAGHAAEQQCIASNRQRQAEE